MPSSSNLVGSIHFKIFNDPLIIVRETPPAINKPIPEPIPHFETISSIYIRSMEPMAIWNIAPITIGSERDQRIVPSARIFLPSLKPITTAAASNNAIIIVRIFCVP